MVIPVLPTILDLDLQRDPDAKTPAIASATRSQHPPVPSSGSEVRA